MPNHTASAQDAEAVSASDQIVQFLHELVRPDPCEQASSLLPRGRGRPRELSGEHLCVAMLLAILRGFSGVACVWRLITWSGVGSFPLLNLTRDAVRKRLMHASLDCWHDLLERVTIALRSWTLRAQDQTLAPFATQVLALDQSTLDAVQRRCQDVRQEADNSPRLLVGKIAGLFDLRRHQWVRVLFREDVFVNEKHQVEELLQGVPSGSLLVADQGYFGFSWFDWLTDQGYWWLSRLREKTSYTVAHVFVEQATTLDALIWLGAYRANRAKHLVRLIQFEQQGVLYQYVTNVRDPQLLSMAEAARLYARRWDIELAFKTLKGALGIRLWWSSHPILVLHQLLGALILAQILHAFQMQVAAQAGVDLFAVSLPVLVRLLAYAPNHLSPSTLIARLIDKGQRQGLLRPSRRYTPLVPAISSPLSPAPAHLLTVRQERYDHRKCEPRSDRPIFAPRFFSFFLL